MREESISLWEEHGFWLEILEDHALFIYDYLSADQVNFIKTAKQYHAAFGQLKNLLNTIDHDLPVNSETMVELAKQINPVAIGYFQFEGHLQRLRINNQVKLNMPPSYLNGTLSENEEYIRLLSYFVRGEKAPHLPLVDLMDLWLEDQLGHTALLIDLLDLVEVKLIQKAEQFKSEFSAHIVKNEAIKGFLRFTPPGFAVQKKFARDVAESVIGFTQLVYSVVQWYEDDELLNSSTLRFIMHHFPEACYFLKKLHFYTPELKMPECSLTKQAFRRRSK